MAFYCSPCQRYEPCKGCSPAKADPTTTETEYVVYSWGDEDMVFARRVFVRHLIGQQLSDVDVLAAVQRDVSHFTAGKYRAVPASRWVDFEVFSDARLS